MNPGTPRTIARAFLKDLLKYALGLLIFVIGIELLARHSALPGLGPTLRGFGALWHDGIMQHSIAVSSSRWLLGWAIGSIIGISLGLVTGRLWAVRIALEGLIVLLRAIPFVCLVPIAMVLFGLEERGKLFIIAWAGATVCWVIADATARGIEPHHKWRAECLGASGRKWVVKVLLPLCGDGIFAALRTSLSLCLIVVAVAEMSGVYERSSGYWWSEGLGYRMFKALDQDRRDLMVASILAFVVLGILGDILLRLVWRGSAGARYFYARRRVRNAVRRCSRLSEAMPFEWGMSQDAKLTDLAASYGKRSVIHGLTMELEAGRTLSIIGPSGCGKTTMIRAIGHLIDDAFKVSGEVKVGEQVIKSPRPEIGLVMQEAPVFEHLTVWENINFGNRVGDNGGKSADELAYFLLSRFGVLECATMKAGMLSGGQRQRVALAMTIANKPDLILLDEPFGALDAITRRTLQKFFIEHIHGKVTAIFVTHDVEEALLVGDAIRIGVDPNSVTMSLVKDGLQPHDWEFMGSFAEQRKLVITELKRIAPQEVGSCG